MKTHELLHMQHGMVVVVVVAGIRAIKKAMASAFVGFVIHDWLNVKGNDGTTGDKMDGEMNMKNSKCRF